HDHGRVGSVLVVIALPDEDLVNDLAFLFGGFHGDIGADLVVHPTAVAVVAININQDAAAGIGGAQASMVMGSSGIMGMWMVTRSPFWRPAKPCSTAATSLTRR